MAAPITCSFRVESLPALRGTYTVSIEVDGVLRGQGTSFIDRAPQSQFSVKLENIRRVGDELDAIHFVGEILWKSLRPDAVREAFETVRKSRGDQMLHLRLHLPPEISSFPWEALYESGVGMLARHPDYSIIREPPSDIVGVRPEARKPGPLRMLILAPGRSGLNTGFEISDIYSATQGLKEKPVIETVTDKVTSDVLLKWLKAQPWDIVHYVGHGDVLADGRGTIRFQGEDGNEWMMEHEVFASFFTHLSYRPSLVVLNCCKSNDPCPTRALSGLGTLLMREKIPAVVAMQYEVLDNAAIRFARIFYEHLLAQETLGRVDIAVDKARDSLLLSGFTKRACITPVLFLAQGQQQLFELPVHQVRKLPPSEDHPADDWSPGKQAKDLLQSLEEGRCVVVAGPGLLQPNLLRRAEGAAAFPEADPLALAKRLAGDAEFPYPERHELDLCKEQSPWMVTQVLQWICQHYLSVKGRGELIDMIDRTFSAIQDAVCPESIRQLGSWPVPLMFYTYYDGFLEKRATSREAPATVVLTSLDSKLPELCDDKRVLVMACGCREWQDSLVLTEDDYEELWDRARNISEEVMDRVTGRTRVSVLFIGVNPRDPVIHCLGKRLLERKSRRRKQGPTYFIWQKPTAADTAYWQEFDVRWIEDDLERLLPLLTTASRKKT
jgi:hypothetical protein